MTKKILAIMLVIATLASCGNTDNGQTTTSAVSESSATTTTEATTTGASTTQTTTTSATTQTTSSTTTTPPQSEETSDISLPIEFTDDDLWLHDYFKENFDNAYRYVELEYLDFSSDEIVEVSFDGADEHVMLYGKAEGEDFKNAEAYKKALSEYYSEEAVKRFMSRVTLVTTVSRTDKTKYDYGFEAEHLTVKAVDGQTCDEDGAVRLTKYMEIDGIMYKDSGIKSGGTGGCFEYSKIIEKTDDKIVFTFPIREAYTEEFRIVAVGEGSLIKEDGKWKFGWFLGDENITDKYDDIWQIEN